MALTKDRLVGEFDGHSDRERAKDKDALTAMRNARMEKMAEYKTAADIHEWKKGYNKEAGLDKGMLGRALDKVQAYVEKVNSSLGLGAKKGVEAHSNNGVATPDRGNPSKLHAYNIEAAENRWSGERSGYGVGAGIYASKDINDLKQPKTDRHMKEHPEHSSAISHNGAVREATTGNIYSRVKSEETVAKKVELENKERKAPIKKHELSM